MQEFRKKYIDGNPKMKKLAEEMRIYLDVENLFLETRIDKGLTQKQLARKLLTKQPSIARWESGSQVPSIKTLEKLAKVAGKKLTIKFE